MSGTRTSRGRVMFTSWSMVCPRGNLAGMYCSRSFNVSMAGLKPGTHHLIAVLAGNLHDPVSKPAEITIHYQPRASIPLPAPLHPAGKASLAITWPVMDAALPPRFNLDVSWRNFQPSCALEGRTDVSGIGHLHDFVDPDLKAMMSGKMMGDTIAGLVGMPGTHTTPMNLAAWGSGPHTVMVMLANNDHTPVLPMTYAMVRITIDPSVTPEEVYLQYTYSQALAHHDAALAAWARAHAGKLGFTLPSR